MNDLLVLAAPPRLDPPLPLINMSESFIFDQIAAGHPEPGSDWSKFWVLQQEKGEGGCFGLESPLVGCQTQGEAHEAGHIMSGGFSSVCLCVCVCVSVCVYAFA